MFDEPQFRSAVAEVLSVEPDQLTAETELASFESYDSTAALSLMVCLSDFSSREFSLSDIRNVVTYGDLVGLIGT